MTRPPLRHDLAHLPRYVAGRAPAADGFKLSSNEVAVPPSGPVVAAMVAVLPRLNRYPEVAGATLAARVAEDLGVPPARVVVGSGSIAVLQQLVQATTDPGRAVVFGWRSYEAYPILARVAHARPVPVPLREHRHDLPAMTAAAQEHDASLVLVCNPNNPTGTTVQAAALERLLDGVPSTCVVVLDEAYREFVTDPAVPDGVRLAEGRENVVVLRTFSKAHGLAGLRVGYGIAPEPVADAVRAVALPFSVSGVAAAGALAALEAWPEQRQVVAQVCEERDRFLTRVRSAGIMAPDSQANFVWLPEESLTAGWADLVEDRGVSIRRYAGEGVRVSVGEPQALAVIEDLLTEEPMRQ